MKPTSRAQKSAFFLFFQQTKLLTVKNVKLQIRNKTALLTQASIGAIFLLLLLFMQYSVNSNAKATENFVDTKIPTIFEAGNSIPRCFPGASAVCFSFVYSPETAVTEAVAARVAALGNLPGKNVPFGYRAFASSAEQDNFFFENPNTTSIGVVFNNPQAWNIPGSAFDYSLQLNTTSRCASLGALKCDWPFLDIRAPMQFAIDSAFLQLYGGPTNGEIKGGFSNFPHPDLPIRYDVMTGFGPLFLYVAVIFNFVIQLQTIVSEKQAHLKDSMTQMGLLNSSYWCSWFLSNLLVSLFVVIILIIMGAILQLEIFLKNDFGTYFFFFFLCSVAFTSFAFTVSTFTRQADTARSMGLFFFILTFVACPVVVAIYFNSNTYDYYKDLRRVLQFIPAFGYFQGVGDLIKHSSGKTAQGLKWSDVEDSNVFWSLGDCYRSFVMVAAIFFFLAPYLDLVRGNEYGQKKNCCFCFFPSYWFRMKKAKIPIEKNAYPNEEEETQLNNDVLKESKNLRNEEIGDRNIALKITGLSKYFVTPSRFGKKMKRIPANTFKAVDKLWYGVDEGQLFALLGHNGAGKTTTINMLTGLMNVTQGDASIFGYSVRTEMDNIQQLMGVCPQHDILWDQLTGREHLHLFARLKGIPADRIDEEVRARLDDVKLSEKEADSDAANYSGGMRRRLSIAIALLGDPKIVFLDEPTTGMDPVTRRHVWDMITRAKVGRVVMLTTHSMEEADVLGDRIGIMARGRMVALGTSLHLKATLGAGFRVTLQVPPIREASILAFIAAETANSAKLVSNVEGHMTFQFPRDDGHDQSEMMASFFAKLEDQKDTLGVLDFSIGMTTLEDVFINTAHKDEEEEKKRQEEKERAAEGVERLDDTEDAKKKGDIEMKNFQKSQEHKVDDTAFLSGASKDVPQSEWAIFRRQFSALWKKNWSFQKRQRKQTCCVILTPVFLIILLLLLQVIIFNPIRDDAQKGVDLNCMSNLFKMTFPTASEWMIGVPYKRSGGPPLEDFGSEAYVDQPQYNILVSGGGSLGALNTTPSVATKSWFSDLQRNARAVTQCDLDYQETLEDRNNLDLQTADEWQTTQNTPSYGASQCTVQDTSTSASTGDYAPSAAILARLSSLQAVRNACKDRASTNLVNKMGGYLLAPELVGSRVASGVLAGVSMHGYVDSLWESVAARIQAILAQNSGAQLAAAVGSCGLSIPLQALTFPVLCGQPCLANATKPLLNDALATMANLPSNSSVVYNATENLCTYILNLDLVRGLTVVPMPSKASMDAALYDEYVALNPTNGQFYFTKFAAFYFQKADDAAASYKYVAYFNNTGAGGGRPGFETGNWLELVNMMDSAIVQRWTNHTITVSTRGFPRLFALKDLDPIGGLSIIDFVASTLLPFLLMLYIYIIVGALVYEKEQKLRMMMKMSGMSMTVYWGVNYVFFFLQYSAMLGVTWILGVLVDMQFFKLHDPSIIFCFLFVWGHTLVALAFLFSMFFSSPKTSTGFSFLLILIFSIVGNQLLQQIIQSPDATESSYASLVWMPPMAMLRSMLWLSLSGARREAITTENWWTVGDGSVPLGILWCFGEWIVMMFFVWYLENTLSVGYGVSKHPCFCFQKRYWKEVRGKLDEEQEGGVEKELKKEKKLRPDVAAEQDRVFDLDGQKNPPVVRVMRLEKEFKRGKTSFKAVNGVTFGINSNECFGLLGHNGAGKTTTINILSGLFKPSGGNAFVKQYSIKTDIDRIYTHMGVCNQHDILWGDLSAIEHLMFYGRLKSLQGKELDEAVKAGLESVKLTKFGNRQAKAFSGGMKRRLSVACALIGSPLVTYLDEPSTGLDPASRHNLWDVIIASKGKRSLILTTHSMEEADVLCDRIGIMDFGRLQCLGTSPELKQRFGAGYTMMVTSSDRSQGSMKNLLAFLVKNWPSATLLNEPIAGSMKLEIFGSEVKLSSCFRIMEANRDDLKITDWGITETTLEEVFLKVTSEGFLTRERAATNSVLMGEQPPSSGEASSPHESRLTVDDGL